MLLTRMIGSPNTVWRREPGSLDRLVMHAVDPDDRLAEHGVETGAGYQRDFVGQVIARIPGGGEVIVADRPRNLGRDVLPERPSQRHVENLVSPAKPEDRLPVLDCPTSQLQLDGVPGRVGPAQPGVGLLAEALGVHVHAAGEKNSVQLIVDRPQRVGVPGEEGNHHRSAASIRYRSVITGVHGPGVGQARRDAVNRLERLGRNTDQRTAHSTTPSAVSRISWSTTALRSPVRCQVASCRSALVPSARIRYA